MLRLGLADDEYSFNLTFPTLATIIKYPKCSLIGNQGDEKGISFKKYGYYQVDKEKYNEINETLNLNNERHPLCFLLEAADDVCYSVSDIEDGFKKGTINANILVEEMLETEFHKNPLCKKLCEMIRLLEYDYAGYENKNALIAQKIRIFAHTEMVKWAADTFIREHEKIISGIYQNELIKDSPAYLLRKFFSKIAKYNFTSDEVLTKELSGEEVLSYLLKRFYKAALSDDCNDSKTTDGKLYRLIAHQFKYVMDKTDYHNKKYLKVLLVIDYISGMTDNYALTMYKKLKGMA